MIKIVIVEDEGPIAQMYKMRLERAGYEVGVAGNGREGLDLCQKMKPDAALVDVMMPEMGGLEMIEKMQATDWGKKPLVMLLTNLSQQESKMDRSKHRIDAYAVKAYHTPSQLLAKVEELLADAGRLKQS